MSYLDAKYLLALVNLLLCVPIVTICGCRINIMSRRTKVGVQVTYALLLMAAGSSAVQPILFNELPGWADLVVNAALLQLLISGRALWPKAVPEPYIRPEEIDESQQVHIVGGKR